MVPWQRFAGFLLSPGVLTIARSFSSLADKITKVGWTAARKVEETSQVTAPFVSCPTLGWLTRGPICQVVLNNH